MRHAKVNAIMYAREYMLTCIFTVLLVIGGITLHKTTMPIDEVGRRALHYFVMIAQSMSYKDSQDHSNELIKMEGRRRKSDWKDTNEVFAWNHRLMEEGDDYNELTKYRVIPPKKKKICRSTRISLRTNDELRWTTYVITAATCWVSANYTTKFLMNLGSEVIRWIAVH